MSHYENSFCYSGAPHLLHFQIKGTFGKYVLIDMFSFKHFKLFLHTPQLGELQGSKLFHSTFKCLFT